MITERVAGKAAELYRYREMFQTLVVREVTARYKGSFFGFVWSLLNPLMMMGIYALIFSVYMKLGQKNYTLFLLVGLLPWNWFATSLTNATGTAIAFSSLIKKVYFPLEVLPMVNVTANLVNFALSLPVLFLFMLFTHAPFTWNLLYLPVLIAIQFIVNLGLSLLLTTLNAFYRDVEQLIAPVLMMWFYVTPVLYAEKRIPPGFRWLILANPMAPIVIAYHKIIMDGGVPNRHLLGVSLGLGIILMVVGYSYFHRRKFTFSEVV